MKFFAPYFLLTLIASAALTEKELESIGRRVWQNECRGTRDGLTSWNTGENFASLGIGHFIWYPAGVDGPFEESFPKLLKFLRENGARVPEWLRSQSDCPWNSREEFLRDFQSPRMKELRDLLASTVPLQSQFLAQRMHNSLGKMVSEASADDRPRIQDNFKRVASTGAGTFALIDYVNFKGEGTNPAERYKGEGWGLLQVLAQMRGGKNAVRDFADAAARVLARRVANSPPERNESRWLPGWKSRVLSYAQ